MSLKSIFSGTETDRVRVPEIEVRGDQLTVQGNESRQQPASGSEEQDQENRSYRLPKTKWFNR